MTSPQPAWPMYPAQLPAAYLPRRSRRGSVAAGLAGTGLGYLVARWYHLHPMVLAFAFLPVIVATSLLLLFVLVAWPCLLAAGSSPRAGPLPRASVPAPPASDDLLHRRPAPASVGPSHLPGAHVAETGGREARRHHGGHRLQQGPLLDDQGWNLDAACLDLAGARPLGGPHGPSDGWLPVPRDVWPPMLGPMHCEV